MTLAVERGLAVTQPIRLFIISRFYSTGFGAGLLPVAGVPFFFTVFVSVMANDRGIYDKSCLWVSG